MRSGSSGETTFTPNDAGVVNAALVNSTFGELAMVVEEEDDCVIDFSGGFEGIEEGTERVIKPKEIGGIIVNGKIGGAEAFRNGVATGLNVEILVEVSDRSQAGVGFPGALCLSGAMGNSGGEVEEEGVAMRLIKKAHTPASVIQSMF